MAKLPWIGHIVTSPIALEGEQRYKVTYFKVGETGFHNTIIADENEIDFDSFAFKKDFRNI